MGVVLVERFNQGCGTDSILTTANVKRLRLHVNVALIRAGTITVIST